MLIALLLLGKSHCKHHNTAAVLKLLARCAHRALESAATTNEDSGATYRAGAHIKLTYRAGAPP